MASLGDVDQLWMVTAFWAEPGAEAAVDRCEGIDGAQWIDFMGSGGRDLRTATTLNETGLRTAGTALDQNDPENPRGASIHRTVHV